MKYNKANSYDKNFIKENIMGPNPIKLLEELLELSPIPEGSTVLDLGCGRGVTSIFLAKEYGVRVFASDLLVSPTDNMKRFNDMGISDKEIIPIRADAAELPFAEGFFDAVVCIDSFHYFGHGERYLDKMLMPIVKHGGYVFIAVPGLKKDIHGRSPSEMKLYWETDDIDAMKDISYWRKILEAGKEYDIVSIQELSGFDECWKDWLECDNEFAIEDRKAINAGVGKYMNLIGMILRRN